MVILKVKYPKLQTNLEDILVSFILIIANLLYHLIMLGGTEIHADFDEKTHWQIRKRQPL